MYGNVSKFPQGTAEIQGYLILTHQGHHFHRLILPRREDQRGATGEGQTIGLAPGAPGEFKGYPTKMLVNGECYRMISNDYIMNGLKATKIYLNGFTGILKSTMKYESR